MERGEIAIRLIDADELIHDRVSNDPVVIATRCMPTIYAKPIRYGRWIFDADYWTWVCTNCHKWVESSAANRYAYCPNCGAKMDLNKDKKK